MTPEAVHYGRAGQIQHVRADALTAAYVAHPERFVKGSPRPWPLPTAAWINRPTIHTTTKGVREAGAKFTKELVSQVLTCSVRIGITYPDGICGDV